MPSEFFVDGVYGESSSVEQVSSFNLHYTESGLFGVHMMCDKSDVNKVVKAVWNEFSKVLKSGIAKEDFNVAK